MTNSIFEYFVGYANSSTTKYSWVYFNSFKEAKNYVANNYANKNLFNIETDGKTTFLINPKF